MANKILVFGEVLYDLFEEKAEIGGTPFNFAAHFSSLGGKADFVSAVGDDELGKKALAELEKRGVGTKFTAVTEKPTGYCKVTLTGGTPSYDLAAHVAYDYIPAPRVRGKYDALYFGTLAQRAETSRKTLKKLLGRSYGEVFYDINIRKPFYTDELINDSIAQATILKISREEAGVLFPFTEPEEYCKKVLDRFQNLRQVVLTLDKDGSMVRDREKGVFYAPKPRSKAVSTVGAGDSFGACYLHHLLKGDEIEASLKAATLLSDYVVTQLGAVPALPPELKEQLI